MIGSPRTAQAVLVLRGIGAFRLFGGVTARKHEKRVHVTMALVPHGVCKRGDVGDVAVFVRVRANQL